MKKLAFCLSVIGVVTAGTATGFAGKPGSGRPASACCAGMSNMSGVQSSSVRTVAIQQGRGGSEIVRIAVPGQAYAVRGSATTIAIALDVTSGSTAHLGGRVQ